MKNFYMVVTVELDKNENIFSDEKKEPEMGLLSYPITVNENQNLLCELQEIKGLKNVTMFATKKKAYKNMTEEEREVVVSYNGSEEEYEKVYENPNKYIIHKEEILRIAE